MSVADHDTLYTLHEIALSSFHLHCSRRNQPRGLISEVEEVGSLNARTEGRTSDERRGNENEINTDLISSFP
jgi:hypothetical protein